MPQGTQGLHQRTTAIIMLVVGIYEGVKVNPERMHWQVELSYSKQPPQTCYLFLPIQSNTKRWDQARWAQEESAHNMRWGKYLDVPAHALKC